MRKFLKAMFKAFLLFCTLFVEFVIWLNDEVAEAGERHREDVLSSYNGDIELAIRNGEQIL